MKPIRGIKQITMFCVAGLMLMMGTLWLTAGTPAGKDSTADVVFSAMKDEMDRSMKTLQIDKMDKPYFLQYTILDTNMISISGDFGALTRSVEGRNRKLKVDLRVGDYQLDSTAFVDRSSLFRMFTGGSNDITVDDNYDVIRHSLWMATDTAYKEALKQSANKKAHIKNQVQTESIPDFSKEKSLKHEEAPVLLKVDREKWEKVVAELSEIFKKFPSIHTSKVDFQVYHVEKYILNSEGTKVRRPELLVALTATASTQAADGMKLKHFVPFYAPSVAEMPGKKEMAAGITKMAEQLTALAAAPVLENYIGPVLFTGQASAELFAQIMVPQLSGQRPPLTNMGQMARLAPDTKLAQRLTRKVLPEEVSVTADPSMKEYNKTKLLGTYSVDDEGVKTAPVQLVEKGILKTLLMSRRPRKEITQSNGHGRSAVTGNVSAQISNLLVSTENGSSVKELEKQMMEFCKDEGLPFGLMIETVDNPGITGVDRETALFSQASGNSAITQPVMVYKVNAENGKKELVRGLAFGEFNLGKMRKIEAVGNDAYIHHRVMSGGGMMSSIYAMFSSQMGGSAAIPATIVAPSLLFEEIELKKHPGKTEKPPMMTHPFFSKK